MGALTQNGQWERALELFARMRSEGLEPDAMGWANAIRAAESAADDGDPSQAAERALGLLEEQLSSDVSTPTRLGWSYAMGAAWKAGDFEAVLRVRDGMLKSGLSLYRHNEVMVAAAEAARSTGKPSGV